MTIIFDLDGTLLNTIDDLGYACNHALGENGFPTHPIEAYPRMVGNGINNLIRRALPEVEQTEENVLRVRECFIPYYNAHNCDFTRPYKGIPEVLQTLKAQGHLLAVASNKYQAATEKIVEHFFPGIFDVVLGEREGIPRKPDPQIVYDVMGGPRHSSKCRRSVYRLLMGICEPAGFNRSRRHTHHRPTRRHRLEHLRKARESVAIPGTAQHPLHRL